VAEVARNSLGTKGFVLYVFFAILLCVLVTAAFLGIAVEALTSHYSLEDLKLAANQTAFRTVVFAPEAGAGKVQEVHALTGGIATVSVIVITLSAPLLGWLLYKRRLKTWAASMLAVAICALSVWLGVRHQLLMDPGARIWFGLSKDPIALGFAAGAAAAVAGVGWLAAWRGLGRLWVAVAALATGVLAVSVAANNGWFLLSNQKPALEVAGLTWRYLSVEQLVLVTLLAYCFVAAWLPVWLVLQPRDFVNVHLLYLGLAAMVLGLIACGFGGVRIDSRGMLNVAEATSKPQLGLLWPFLFVTIACGACSGAHGLICGGTTCKQLASEKHAPLIGYGAMLLEAVLALCVVFMIIGPLGFEQYRNIVWPSSGGAFAVKGFALAVGTTLHRGAEAVGLSIPIFAGTIFGIILLEGFVLTTVDTLMRLARYLFEELWGVLFKNPPRWMTHRTFNTLLPVVLAAWLALGNRYGILWPIFGTANQLLAALTLIAATAWLAHRAKQIWFVAIPALFMAATTLVSLALLLPRYFGWKKFTELTQQFPAGQAWQEFLKIPPKQGGLNLPLFITDLILMALAIAVVALVVRRWIALWGRRRTAANP
jgi:carbon starvation protein CstA